MQIILHIGQQKTASSTIQKFLAQNRTELAARKVLYARALGESKANLISGFVTNDPGLAASRETILSGLDREFSGDYARAIISNENLLTSGEHVVERVKATFGPYANSWRILCYVRRPDEHVVSQYQQKVRGGYVGTFDQFFDEQLNSRYYGYARWADLWARHFGREAIEVRVFHRRTLQGGPVEDFVGWVGLEREGLAEEERAHVKESLDRLNTEILRFLHLCQIERPDLLGRHDVKRMLRRLGALDMGDRMRLDTDRARRLQERFRADHERLAERYLAPDHAAVLLAPPADVPPPAPLDRDVLYGRMMALFGDPELARLAVARAEEPTEQRSTSGKLLRPKKGSKVERVLRRHEKAHKRSKPKGAGKGTTSADQTGAAGGTGTRPGGMIGRLRAYLRSGARWIRSRGS